MALVTVDNVLLLIYVMDSAYLNAFEKKEPVWYNWVFPYLWHPLKNMVTCASVYMVVAVATER